MAFRELYGLGHGLSSRLMTLQSIQQQMDRQAALSKEWEESLLSAAPEELREWLTTEDVDVIILLVSLGRCSVKIRFDEHPLLDTYEQVVAAMDRLREAWKEGVEINVSEPEPHRVEVRFVVKM